MICYRLKIRKELVNLKKFKLVSKISCSSKTLNLFNENNVLTHYKDIDEVFENFYNVRLELYQSVKTIF